MVEGEVHRAIEVLDDRMIEGLVMGEIDHLDPLRGIVRVVVRGDAAN
jgi:hypothetical protein